MASVKLYEKNGDAKAKAVQENLEKHIHSVLNRMFTAFLQLNAILKCLFLQK